jgi:hypothetical protein
MERYTSLVLAAEDAREHGVPCFHLMRGTGVPRDLERARSCFERHVQAEGGCGGSSPSLTRLELGLLSSNKDLFADCFADGSVEAVGRAPTEKADPHICDDGFAMTTLHMVACVQLDLDELEVRASAVDKAVLARFGDARHASFREASADLAAYARDMADLVGELYAGGSMQPIQISSAELAVLSARLERWQSLLGGRESKAEPAAARARLLAKRDEVMQMAPPATIGGSWTDTAWRARLRMNEKAYAPYRAKELALVRAVGGESSKRLEALIDVERTNDLAMLEEH